MHVYFYDPSAPMQFHITLQAAVPGLTQYHFSLKVHFKFLLTSCDLSLKFNPISHSAVCPMKHFLLHPPCSLLLLMYPSSPFSHPLSFPASLSSFALTDCCCLAVMVLTLSGSQMTMSASEPTAIRPLRGYRLKILAALVDVTATN